MKNSGLVPYNVYILYAALILLVIFLIMTAVHAARLLKTLKAMNTSLKPVKDNVTLARIKVEAMQETKAENKKKDKIAAVVIPFLLYAYQLYRKDDELHGIKGYNKAVAKAAANRREENRVIRKVKADL